MGVLDRAAVKLAVHPRVCGELGFSRPSVPPVAGSSPRVRGTRFKVAVLVVAERFIPACAGNSLGILLSPLSLAGSSPRVRGTRRWLQFGKAGERFIPACAGNSSISMCSSGTESGSSPRVRGTLAEAAGEFAGGRFIPACAGNSVGSGAGSSRTAVHPRVCGELALPCSRPASGVGSSPRVRGTRVGGGLLRRGQRFIPACAGNSALDLSHSTSLTVHPRVCGELPILRRG